MEIRNKNYDQQTIETDDDDSYEELYMSTEDTIQYYNSPRLGTGSQTYRKQNNILSFTPHEFQSYSSTISFTETTYEKNTNVKNVILEKHQKHGSTNKIKIFHHSNTAIDLSISKTDKNKDKKKFKFKLQKTEKGKEYKKNSSRLPYNKKSKRSVCIDSDLKKTNKQKTSNYVSNFSYRRESFNTKVEANSKLRKYSKSPIELKIMIPRKKDTFTCGNKQLFPIENIPYCHTNNSINTPKEKKIDHENNSNKKANCIVSSFNKKKLDKKEKIRKINMFNNNEKSEKNEKNKKLKKVKSQYFQYKVRNYRGINCNNEEESSIADSLKNTDNDSKCISNINVRKTNNKAEINREFQRRRSVQLETKKKNEKEDITPFTNKDSINNIYQCMELLVELYDSEMPRCQQQVNFHFPKDDKKKIALFDLDETLVHCNGQIDVNNIENYTKERDAIIDVSLPHKTVKVAINIRPYWKECLDLIKDYYHIVIYTASHDSYANAVLDYLDKDNKIKYFKYRLYRNHCVQCNVDGVKFYVKDLNILTENYDLKNVVLIDNSVLSFAYHLDNGFPVIPYINNKSDEILNSLALYLVNIADCDDITKKLQPLFNIRKCYLQTKEEMDKEGDSSDESSRNSGDRESVTVKKDENKNISHKSKSQKKDEKTEKSTETVEPEEPQVNKTNIKKIKSLRVHFKPSSRFDDIYKREFISK